MSAMYIAESIRHIIIPPIVKYIAHRRVSRIRVITSSPAASQKLLFQKLIHSGKNTLFGRDHGFSEIKTYHKFSEKVPIRNYENLLPYISDILAGKQNVLWEGNTVALGFTSGTTSGSIKYIPVTKESIPHFQYSWWSSIFSYIEETGNTTPLEGKTFFMSHRPDHDRVSGIPVGSITGLTRTRVPKLFRNFLLPSYSTSCIDDYNKKLDAMVEETVGEDVTIMIGVPPWLQLYFDRVIEKTGKKIGEIFPRLSVLVHGGINCSPYRAKMEESIGRRVDTIEVYMATEGFVAFQDSQTETGILLNLMGGIFFEFVPAEEINSANPHRFPLEAVELDVNYAVIMTSNAGLWAYDIGDTVKFVSKNPYRIIVTGRTKHFINTFSEHLITENVEGALTEAAEDEGVKVREFTVAPEIKPADGLPHHDWFIEFEQFPSNLEAFAAKIDAQLRKRNVGYDRLVSKNILEPLTVYAVRRYGFKDYMASIGKLGGQHKVPRLCNNRSIADAMLKYVVNG
jgi:hypothetical protein